MTRLKSASVVFLSSLTILIPLLALAQIDFQMVLFLRSVHIPVLERIGNVGNWLGGGETLIILCVALFLIGYVWKSETWRLAGLDGVVAHAIAGITVQIPKHVIGRPRPRWTHQQAFEYGPSFQGGFDAFPSGHAAASFAVAAVLARYFPRGAWVWYGAALFVAMSRVIRGSHFLTDALAGATLGFIVGYVWVRPLKEWRESLLQALSRCLPLVIVAFSIVWVACSKPVHDSAYIFMQWIGMMWCLIGVILRLNWSWSRPSVAGPVPRFFFWAPVTIGLGLAMVSQSVLIIGLVTIALLTWWLARQDEEWWEGFPKTKEVLAAGVILGLMLTLREIQGLVPLG